MNEPFQSEWVMPTLAIALALTLAIGVGFLVGQQTPPAPDDMSAICQLLPQEGLTAECIALRSAVATEGSAWISRWALWLSFGSLVASAGAFAGLIIAFMQGQRTIALAAYANRISLENGQAQARAYVVVESVECKLSEHGRLTAKVKFQNSGLSPARRLRWGYNANLNIFSTEHEQYSLTLGDEPDLEQSHWRQDIPSANSWTSVPTSLRTVDNSEVIALINKAKFISVTIIIVSDFQDVFGITHREITCFQGGMTSASSDDPYTELTRARDGAFARLGQALSDQGPEYLAAVKAGDIPF